MTSASGGGDLDELLRRRRSLLRVVLRSVLALFRVRVRVRGGGVGSGVGGVVALRRRALGALLALPRFGVSVRVRVRVRGSLRLLHRRLDRLRRGLRLRERAARRLARLERPLERRGRRLARGDEALRVANLRLGVEHRRRRLRGGRLRGGCVLDRERRGVFRFDELRGDRLGGVLREQRRGGELLFRRLAGVVAIRRRRRRRVAVAVAVAGGGQELLRFHLRLSQRQELSCGVGDRLPRGDDPCERSLRGGGRARRRLRRRRDPRGGFLFTLHVRHHGARGFRDFNLPQSRVHARAEADEAPPRAAAAAAFAAVVPRFPRVPRHLPRSEPVHDARDVRRDLVLEPRDQPGLRVVELKGVSWS